MANTNTILESNFLSPSRFILVVDTPKFESVSYHLQTVSIPTVSVQRVEAPWMQHQPSLTGDRVIFDPLTVRFIIDENMDNYSKLFDWIVETVNVNSQSAMKKDLSLLIYNNSNNLNKTIQFIGAFPTSLSPVEFSSTNSDTQFLFSDVEFSIDYYSFRT